MAITQSTSHQIPQVAHPNRSFTTPQADLAADEAVDAQIAQKEAHHPHEHVLVHRLHIGRRHRVYRAFRLPPLHVRRGRRGRHGRLARLFGSGHGKRRVGVACAALLPPAFVFVGHSVSFPKSARFRDSAPTPLFFCIIAHRPGARGLTTAPHVRQLPLR